MKRFYRLKLINKFLFLIFFINSIYADSFKYNSYNNHGVVGLINTPTARSYNEGVHGVTIYNGTPDQKITLSSNPYEWLEASFFYTNLQGLPYPGFEYQDYKDKGFNLKLKLLNEGYFPSIAIGFNDFAGTGLYSSEYIVASYGIDNVDIHTGIGWGALSDINGTINNPLGYIHDSFKTRSRASCKGGCFNLNQYFSGEAASPFFGISYRLRDSLLFKFEKDTTFIDRAKLPYLKRESDYSYGFDYFINDNFTIGASYERGSFYSFKFVYKNDPIGTRKKYQFQEPIISKDDNKYTKLIKNLEENGIGVNKITETTRSIGLELTQFIHPDLNIVEDIISQASISAGITKPVKKDIEISNLRAVTELDDNFKRNSRTIYERPTSSRFNTFTQLKFRPFIASREEFFKGALLLENDSEIIIKENLFLNANLKYSLANNFEDLRFGPIDKYPAQVRSDVKQYLKNMDDGLLLGRLQLDYHLTPKINHHLMFTGGILEDMFSGIGMEYLYFKQDSNFALGVEIFKVRKRDYEWGFGHLEYENTLANANFYYRNYGSIPFDMKISAGEYLAGDIGSTIEFSRTLDGGLQFGVFATFTDVSTQQFGEGSFDKGLFFNIPIYGNLINYTWRPLTKDPGAKLIRMNNLHDLLVKLRPIN